MSKKFNITGICIPEMHYMVNIEGKLNQIMKMVTDGEYFTINRPRQYGKTTTLYLLENRLDENNKYLVLSISFEGIGDDSFHSERSFIEALSRQFKRCLVFKKETALLNFLEKNKRIKTLDEFSDFLTEFIVQSSRRVVLMIDEVDKSSNIRLFLNFLGLLRNKYLLRNQKKDYTFHSVILAGVHDVKSLKLKIRTEREQKFNSPWNIAVDFNIDLSFSPEEIATMLEDYEKNNDIKMEIKGIAAKLYYYTSGYPFLVSRLCKTVDEYLMPEKERKEWDIADIDLAVRNILQEKNTNFDSIIKNLENNPELYNIVFDIIVEGAEKIYNQDNHLIGTGDMYGIFREENEKIKIHNRIYEQRIYNYMISNLETSTNMEKYNFKNSFIAIDGKLDFEKILTKFQEFMKEEYSERDSLFLERNGRLLFLAFLKPIINGNGFDFKEVQVSEEKRLDVVVTYLNAKYVAELKIWRGEQAHQQGLKQLRDYLECLGLDQGYLVIYDFRKAGRKEWKKDRTIIDGKEITMVWV